MEMARGGPNNPPPSECNGDRNGSELLGLKTLDAVGRNQRRNCSKIV